MNLGLKILAMKNTWTVKGRSYPHLTHKVMRLQTGLPLRTPTVELTQATNSLSVQQLTAYTTLATVQRCIASKQPRYMADKLQLRTNEGNATFPLRHENTLRIQSNLTLARGGFFCRGSALFNQLPPDLRSPMEPKLFKLRLKAWVRSNIPVKPG